MSIKPGSDEELSGLLFAGTMSIVVVLVLIAIVIILRSQTS